MRANQNDKRLALDAVERLESRQMMAGDVTAFFNSSGDLIISGDNASNRVLVEYTDNDVRVTGFYAEGNTTINEGQGSTILTTPESGIRDIKLNLRGGNDTIEFSRVAGRKSECESRFG